MLLSEFRAHGVWDESQNEIPEKLTNSEGNSDTPVNSSDGGILSAFHGDTSENDNDALTTNDDEPDDDVHEVVEDTSEDPFLVVDLPSVEHVEDLHPHEHIEHIGELSARAPVGFLERVKRSLIPIVRSSRVDMTWAPWVFELLDGLWEPVVSSEHDGVDDSDLIDGVTKEMLDHLSGNDVFVSLVRRSLE